MAIRFYVGCIDPSKEVFDCHERLYRFLLTLGDDLPREATERVDGELEPIEICNIDYFLPEGLLRDSAQGLSYSRVEIERAFVGCARLVRRRIDRGLPIEEECGVDGDSLLSWLFTSLTELVECSSDSRFTTSLY